MKRCPDDPAPPAPPAERRGWVRYACTHDTSCRRPLDPRGGRWRTRVLDLSRRGVRLLLRRRFERGTLLHLRLPGRDGGAPRDMLVRVTRVSRAAPPACHTWLVGGTLDPPLAEGELRDLLA